MKRTLLLLPLLALGACNGPWNTSVDSSEEPLTLRVASFQVAGAPFDTIWLERTLQLSSTYDSTLSFVDSARLRVVRLDQADTVWFGRASGNTRAWIPLDTAARVAWGARYRFEGWVRWNRSRNFPTETETAEDTLWAETYTPASFSLGDSILAPLEALVEPLASGLSSADLARAKADPESTAAAWNLLDPRAKLDSASVAAVLQGEPVLRRIGRGDSVWYVYSTTKVTDEAGNTVQAQYRSFHLDMSTDGARFGGLLFIHGFDTSGARILDAVRLSILDAVGRSDVDSANFYEPGDYRQGFVRPDYYDGDSYYPDSLYLQNIYLAYTGRASLRFYAFDSLYYEYYRTNSEGVSKTSYSNVRGGGGYFSAAGVDSLRLYIKAPTGAKAYSVPDLRRAWCRQQRKDDGADWNPGTLCSDV